MGKQRALLAGLAAATLSLAGAAPASPLLTLQIEGSTTGAPGSYVSNFGGNYFLMPGQTIYYEVNAIFDKDATNSNTANSPNGTTDSINNLPNFQLTASPGDAFVSTGNGQYGTMQNGFGNNSGTGVTQPNGANTVVIRASQASGVYVNADSPLTLETGQLTVGISGPLAGYVITGAYYSSLGGMKVSGVITPVTTTSETSSDPMIGYSPLTSIEPEPASLAIFGLGAMGLLRRRRLSA